MGRFMPKGKACRDHLGLAIGRAILPVLDRATEEKVGTAESSRSRSPAHPTCGSAHRALDCCVQTETNVMPVIARLSNATINIYFGDEAPPHFHLRGPNSNAKISIETLQVMRGHSHRSDYAEAIAWAVANLDLPRMKWNECNERD